MYASTILASVTTVALLVIISASYSSPVEAWGCHSIPHNNTFGPPNLNPIDTNKPVFVRRVANGELYTVGSNSEDRINLVHLYGKTGYDFGFAQGQLMKEESLANLNSFWNYMLNEIEQVINGTSRKDKIILPNWFIKAVSEVGIDAALGLQNDFCKKYMEPSWYDEMKGLADATGMSYKRIVDVHMVGELTKGRCSFYGLTNTATLGGKTLQLRALDWDMGTGIQNNPQVTIYHPAAGSGLGYPFANVAWSGVVMTLTAMSSNKLGISEIGISYPDAPPAFGDEVPWGIPFTFLERKLVQFTKTIDDQISMIQNANRTCHLILGIADGNAKQSRLVQYSHSIVRFFTGSDLEPHESWKPRISPDIVYAFMDWSCPFYNTLGSKLLKKYNGQITPELSIKHITAEVGTGDLHANVFDLTDDVLYTANARGAHQTGPDEAYKRQWVRIELANLWNKPFGQN